MLTEREEHVGEEERGQGGGAHADAEGDEDEGMCGRLGRAFHAGYSCDNEQQFFHKFGTTLH